MFNITYKHLEDPVKLAGLSLLQWAQLLVCVIAAYGLSKLLPLPDQWALSVAVTFCGMPAAAAVVAMQADFDVAAYVGAVLRWYRHRSTYQAGANPNDLPAGYHVATPASVPATEAAAAVFDLRPDELWNQASAP
jgi:hypothetical protein